MFLAILGIGLFSRHFNCWRTNDLRAKLFKHAEEDIRQITLISGDTTDLIRHDHIWTAVTGDENLMLPDSIIRPVLETLLQMESSALLKTKRPDTLGFNAPDAVTIICRTLKNPMVERFRLGKMITTNGQPSTWIAISSHEQYYLAKGDIKKSMRIDLKNLEKKRCFLADTTAVTRAAVIFGTDTMIWQSNIPGSEDSLQIWIQNFYSATFNAQEADFFDVERDESTAAGKIIFSTENEDRQWEYHLFFAAVPVIPDDPALIRKVKNFQPQYVISGDKLPGIYFALPDTVGVREIMTRK